MYRKVDSFIVAGLKEIVGQANVLVGDEALEPYSHDQTVGLAAYPEVVVKVTGVPAICCQLYDVRPCPPGS